MSHHLDSRIAREDVRLDITDLHVFRGDSGTVFVMNVCHSIAGNVPVPGYHHEGMYEFKIDTDGDAVEDISYRFVFEERDGLGLQTYVLRKLVGHEAADPTAQGSVLLEGQTEETAANPDGLRVWTGIAGDPFWIEPDVLHAVQDGTKVDLGNWTPIQARNLFAGHRVFDRS